jgi:hypothetical protein
MAPDEWEPVQYEVLDADAAPPCLAFGGGDEVAIADPGDYEAARRRYAPQGEYVSYTADGSQSSFALPYQPLDVNGDGVIGPSEIIIYVTVRPLYATVNGETIRISSNPIWIENGEILIFMDVPPGTVERTVPYREIFEVDPVSGEVTFRQPPQEGSRVSICGSKKLYAEYGGRTCSIPDEFFVDRMLIGKSITGNGCLHGFDTRIYLDHENRKLVYVGDVDYEDYSGFCTEEARTITRWVSAEQPPFGYEVVFLDRGR